MDIVHAFEPAPTLFSQRFVLDKVLYTSPASQGKRVSIIRFLALGQAQSTCLVRFQPNGEKAQHELLVLHRVEEMRKALGLASVMALRGYMLCADPLAPQAVPKAASYLGVLMDEVPLKHTELDKSKMQFDDVVGIMLDLLHTIWLARKHYQFYHGDLHMGNILFSPTALAVGENSRLYVMNGHRFTIASPYLPVMIDFEKSFFGPGKERFSDVRLIVSAAFDLLQTLGFEESPAFKELYDHVLSYEFIDSRFTPETIERIVTQFELFAPLRQRLAGDEPLVKKIKACAACAAPLVALECSACRVQFCSQRCAQNAWRGVKDCHLSKV